MKNKFKIICTLGPSSLNKSFLTFAKYNVDLLRLNMSHLNVKQLEKNLIKIKKYCKIPICIDTEGAQIRTKINKPKLIRSGQVLKIFPKQIKNNLSFYPSNIYEELKVNDVLNIGFSSLVVRITKKNKYNLFCKAISQGMLENNKGVHLQNRKINMNYITEKDLLAIKIGKKYNINNYALSFTNSSADIKKFNSLLTKENKIFKIETIAACKNFKDMVKYGKFFLIDRGDLSKDTKIENIPIFQRDLFKIKNKRKGIKIFVATNLLESMILNNSPTRGEANDIFNSLEMGANGLVLAAETAIGNNPKESVMFLKRMIRVFRKSKYIN